MAVRIRLRRSAGWRKPHEAVVVARPTKWGNPFRIGVDGDRARCVALYEHALRAGELAFTIADVRNELEGRDLACWCSLDDPCHADVLLRIANSAIAARCRPEATFALGKRSAFG